MAVESRPFYWLVCDSCGVKSTEKGEYSAWGDMESVFADADDSEWRLKDNRHFCPDCLPDWCLECERDITPENPRLDPEDGWECRGCAGVRETLSAPQPSLLD